MKNSKSKLFNLKENEDKIAINDKSDLLMFIFYLIISSFFFFFSLIPAYGHYSVSIILFIFAILFVLSAINRLFIYDLSFNKKSGVIQYKKIFPLMVSKIYVNDVSSFFMKNKESKHLGQNSTYVYSSDLFIYIKKRNGKEIEIAVINIPNKIKYKEEILECEIKKIITIFNSFGIEYTPRLARMILVRKDNGSL